MCSLLISLSLNSWRNPEVWVLVYNITKHVSHLSLELTSFTLGLSTPSGLKWQNMKYITHVTCHMLHVTSWRCRACPAVDETNRNISYGRDRPVCYSHLALLGSSWNTKQFPTVPSSVTQPHTSHLTPHTVMTSVSDGFILTSLTEGKGVAISLWLHYQMRIFIWTRSFCLISWIFISQWCPLLIEMLRGVVTLPPVLRKLIPAPALTLHQVYLFSRPQNWRDYPWKNVNIFIF